MQRLKYPDQDLVRFFYKEHLNETPGNVIEFGCGCGNNLKMFAEAGYTTMGVDIDPENIDYARKQLKGGWIVCDMYDYIKITPDQTFWDVVLFPSSLYYLPKEKIEYILSNIQLKHGAMVYFKMRETDDYRARFMVNGKLDIDETGEKGCEMSFYNYQTFINCFPYIWEKEPILLLSQWGNLMNDQIIKNSDFQLWGKVCGKTSV